MSQFNTPLPLLSNSDLTKLKSRFMIGRGNTLSSRLTSKQRSSSEVHLVSQHQKSERIQQGSIMKIPYELISFTDNLTTTTTMTSSIAKAFPANIRNSIPSMMNARSAIFNIDDSRKHAQCFFVTRTDTPSNDEVQTQQSTHRIRLPAVTSHQSPLQTQRTLQKSSLLTKKNFSQHIPPTFAAQSMYRYSSIHNLRQFKTLHTEEDQQSDIKSSNDYFLNPNALNTLLIKQFKQRLALLEKRLKVEMKTNRSTEQHSLMRTRTTEASEMMNESVLTEQQTKAMSEGRFNFEKLSREEAKLIENASVDVYLIDDKLGGSQRQIQRKIDHFAIQKRILLKFQQLFGEKIMQIGGCADYEAVLNSCCNSLTDQYYKFIKETNQRSYRVEIPYNYVPLMQQFNDFYTIDHLMEKKKKQSIQWEAIDERLIDQVTDSMELEQSIEEEIRKREETINLSLKEQIIPQQQTEEGMMYDGRRVSYPHLAATREQLEMKSFEQRKVKRRNSVKLIEKEDDDDIDERRNRYRNQIIIQPKKQSERIASPPRNAVAEQIPIRNPMDNQDNRQFFSGLESKLKLNITKAPVPIISPRAQVKKQMSAMDEYISNFRPSTPRRRVQLQQQKEKVPEIASPPQSTEKIEEAPIIITEIVESIPIEVEERVAVVEEIKLIKEEYGPDDYDTIDRKRKIGTGLFDKLTSFENLLHFDVGTVKGVRGAPSIPPNLEFSNESEKTIFKQIFSWQHEVNMDLKEMELRLNAFKAIAERESSSDEEDDETDENHYRGIRNNSIHSSEITDFGPAKPFSESLRRIPSGELGL